MQHVPLHKSGLSIYLWKPGIETGSENKVCKRGVLCIEQIGDYEQGNRRLSKSNGQALQALKMAEENNFLVEKSRWLRIMGLLYRDLKEYPKALEFSQQSLRNSLKIKDSIGIAYAVLTIANYFNEVNR